ncbi:MAG: hypothetical protein IK083_04010 [Abditibacteriota bacterium]|nr:hypothetical protein [Abditibacteriota bacterium]
MKHMIAIVAVLALIFGALAVCGSIKAGGSGGTATAGKADPRASEFDRVDVKSLAKTGLVSELETTRTPEDCAEGTSEEILPLGGGKQVVFRTVCSLGPGKSEGDSETAVRRTLTVLLREKTPDGEAAEEVIKEYAASYRKGSRQECCDYPYIMDAAVSDDGRTLRYIVNNQRFRYESLVELYQYDLTEKDWRDKYGFNSYCLSRFVIDPDSSMWNQDPIKQACLLAPDVVYIATKINGVELAERIRLDNREAKRKMDEFYRSQEYLSGKYKGTAVPRYFFLTGVYWNRAGAEQLIAAGWNIFKEPEHSETGENIMIKPGTLINDRSLPDKKPVPTEKDWEGWHKLVRHSKDK